jgi:hypothetical protein
MRSDLSFEKFTAILAALGASTVFACGGATPQPVQANEVTPAAAATPGHASCSANGCSGKAGVKSDAPSAAALPASVASPTTPAAVPAPAPASASTSATSAAAEPAASSPSRATAPPVKPTAKEGTKKAAAPKVAPAGEASCGAGTCSGDTKKKIL